MTYHQIKVGNILQYGGRFGGFHNRNAMVLSIDPTHDDKDSFAVKLKNWKGEVHEIRAYDNELWSVTVERTHLEKLGFILDHRGVYTLEGLVLVRPTFTKGDWHSVQFIDKGFVAVEKELDLPLKEEQVDANTTPVTSLHMLQNYLEGKLVKQIDWDIFL